VIQRVSIVPSTEEHSPPEEVVELAVIGPDVFLTVCKWEEDGKGVRTEDAIQVPPLRLTDLCAALGAFLPGWAHLVIPREPE
jgi:hypothetical protein